MSKPNRAKILEKNFLFENSIFPNSLIENKIFGSLEL